MQSEHLGQDEGGAPVVVEPLEQRLEVDPSALVGGEERAVRRSCARFVDRLSIQATSPHGTARVIDTRPPGDRQQPPPSRSVGAVTMDRGDRPLVGLLGEIVGVVEIAQVAADPPHIGLRLRDESFERPPIAVARCDEQPREVIHGCAVSQDGNQIPTRADLGHMECDVVRDVLSARLDGEALADETAVAERHLTTCVDCRTFAERLAVLDRSVRVRSAEPVPDLVERVVARARPARLGRANWMRPALAWVAVVMLVQSVPALVLGDASGANPHMARHLGAFGAALAIGFAYAAWRPHRAFGLLPFTGALVATTVVSAITDTADGSVRPLSESTHIAELIGLVLLWMIAGSPGWPLRIRSVRSWRAPGDRSVRPPSATT